MRSRWKVNINYGYLTWLPSQTFIDLEQQHLLTQVSPFLSGVTIPLAQVSPLVFAQLSPSGVIFMDVTIAYHPQAHTGMATCCLPAQLAASFFTQDCPSSKRFLLPGIFYYLVLTIQAPGFPCLYRGLADSSRFGIKILSGK